jgi:L-cystine transport system permease protein
MLPQGLVIALPNLGNSLISLFKEGSLAFTIGLIDMMGAGNLIISRNYGAYSLETYLALAVIYWALTLIIEQIFLRLEKHYSKGRRSLNAA